MATLTHDYYCGQIGMATELRIVLPDRYLLDGSPDSTLILLSPEGESGLGFYQKGDIAAICDEFSLCAVLVPSLEGCYTDMKLGYPFYASLKNIRNYISEYLPGIPMQSGKMLIAGASSGGRAALRLAMEEPELFRAAASFSGLITNDREPNGWFTEKRMSCLYGTREERKADDDAFAALCAETSQDSIYLYVSQEDPDFAGNEKIASLLGSKAVLVKTEGKDDYKIRAKALRDFLKRVEVGE